jgi:hypothetical protein
MVQKDRCNRSVLKSETQGRVTAGGLKGGRPHDTDLSVLPSGDSHSIHLYLV